MEKRYKKKITWTIKNFSSLQSIEIYSDHFIVDGCKWRFLAYPKGNKVVDYLSLYVEVANYESLPSGWRRHAKYSCTIVNQLSEKLNAARVNIQNWYEHTSPNWGLASLFPLKDLHAKNSGFLEKGELKIAVTMEVLEVIGKFDISDETSTITETVDVNGFQLLPSQVKFVSRMFERHSKFASELHPKNSNLRAAYMSFLVSVIETMCKSPHDLSKDDMFEAYAALGSMTDAGFKLDWLEKKLDVVLQRKEKEHSGETRVQGMKEELKEMKKKCSEMEALVEKELKEMKLKCSELEALVEKEKGEVVASKVVLSLDDMV